MLNGTDWHGNCIGLQHVGHRAKRLANTMPSGPIARARAVPHRPRPQVGAGRVMQLSCRRFCPIALPFIPDLLPFVGDLLPFGHLVGFQLAIG